MFNLNSKKGMTLIEIVGVVLIIALIAMFAVPRVLEKYRDAQATKIVNDAKTIEDALDILEMKYYADNKVKGNYGIEKAKNSDDGYEEITNEVEVKQVLKMLADDMDNTLEGITEESKAYKLNKEGLAKEIDSISESYDNFFVVVTPAGEKGKTHRVFHKKGVRNGSDEIVYGVHMPILTNDAQEETK